MKYWLFIDGRQQGPFSYDELMTIPFTAETPIWYEGLSGWMPAGQAPATAALFGGMSGNRPAGESTSACNPGTDACGDTATSWTTTDTGSPSHGTSGTAWTGSEPMRRTDGVAPCPPTNLGWAIAATICCCIPLGVAAIFMATRVTSRWQNGDYDGARRASETTEWLIILSIVLGLLWAPVGMMIGGF